MAFGIKKGDTVQVIAGKEKGKTGKVLRILKDSERALVEKVNLVKKHAKPNKTSPQGGIIEKEASIHISNLMYYNEKKGKAMRIGSKTLADGKKVRVFKLGGEVIEEK